MRNMKVRAKLLTGFIIVTILAIAVGVIGILNLNRLNADYTDTVEMNGKPLADAGHSIADLHAVRAELRAAMLFTGDAGRVQSQAALVQGFLDDFELRTKAYDGSIQTPNSRELFDAAMAEYQNNFLPAVEKTLADAESGVPQSELVAYMVSTIKPSVDLVTANLQQCMENKATNLDTTSAEGAALAQSSFILLLLVVAAVAVISVVFGLYLSGMISKPLATVTAFMNKAGSTGDISLDPDDVETIGKYSAVRDELGQVISATASFVGHVTECSKVLETVAGGDLTAELKLLSDRDTMGLSLRKMTENLNNMFSEINASSVQVSTGSGQVATGAQALAAGATEQAASIEQLSSSITEIAERTRENAVKAEQTAKLAETIKGSAEKGSRQMGEMMTAVKEINEASQSISKVIKTIDDIAFQTNILALNAAVEAARAGQHGKGFAVVAEEVRNLAAKSAEAAKDTESLIANSMEKAELGVRIADETAASLSEIVSGINESDLLMSEIATSSEEQALAISQINTGIDQVAQVVQQNSATAEESAAASEEMSGQSTMLQELISKFKLKGGSAGSHSFAAETPKRAAAPARFDEGRPASDNKY